jgi:hypothetical protein
MNCQTFSTGLSSGDFGGRGRMVMLAGHLLGEGFARQKEGASESIRLLFNLIEIARAHLYARMQDKVAEFVRKIKLRARAAYDIRREKNEWSSALPARYSIHIIATNSFADE